MGLKADGTRLSGHQQSRPPAAAPSRKRFRLRVCYPGMRRRLRAANLPALQSPNGREFPSVWAFWRRVGKCAKKGREICRRRQLFRPFARLSYRRARGARAWKRGRFCRRRSGATRRRWRRCAGAIIPASVAMPMSSRARARRPRTPRRKRSWPCCGRCRNFAARMRASSRAGFCASPATAYTARRAASGSRPCPKTSTRPTPPRRRASAWSAPSGARVRQALDALDAESREMIALRYELELSYRQSAATLETTAARVKWRLHDAREKLRTLLGDEGP